MVPMVSSMNLAEIKEAWERKKDREKKSNANGTYWSSFERFWDFSNLHDVETFQLEGKAGRSLFVPFIHSLPSKSRSGIVSGLKEVCYTIWDISPDIRRQDLGKI